MRDNLRGTVSLDENTQQSKKSKSGVTQILTLGQESTVSERKLVGFLVSFDLDSKGKFFQLFEGKNLIGSSAICQVCISTDSGVSAKHVTILFRGAKFRLKDEFSTNGTFVNNEMIEEGFLKDKDELKVGNTRFTFLKVPPLHKY